MTQPPAGPPYPPQPPAGPPYPPQPPAGQPYPPQPPAGQPYPPSSAGQYPPPYPPPPAYGKPVAQAQTTSGFAVASLVLGLFGFCGALFSIIFGIIALGKTKAGGQRGRGMAIAGLVLSAVWTVIVVIAVVGYAMKPTHSVSAFSVTVGNCLAEIPSGQVSEVNTTSCDRPHSGEVVGVLKMPDGSYPADSVFDDYKEKCSDALLSYSSTAAQDSNVGLGVLRPTQETWQRGDRDMVCIAKFSTQRTGSIKG